jgi:hypothetical protein
MMSAGGQANSTGVPPDQISKQSRVIYLSLYKHWYYPHLVVEDSQALQARKAVSLLRSQSYQGRIHFLPNLRMAPIS